MLPGLLQAIVWVTSGVLIAIGGGLIWSDYAPPPSRGHCTCAPRCAVR